MDPRPYNPYVPPAAPPPDPGHGANAPPSPAGPVDGLKWVYAAVAALILALLLFLLVLARPLGLPPSIIHAVAFVADKPLHWTLMAIALAWIYTAWERIPEPARAATTPGSAIGYLFIPFYNLYWLFAVNQRLCDAVDRCLVNGGAETQSARSYALAGPILQIATSVVALSPLRMYGWIPSTLAHVAWFLLMLQLDPAIRAARARGTTWRRDDTALG